MGGRFRWRDYRTVGGARPIKSFIDGLADDEAAAVVAAMKEVAVFGLERARHLHDDLYEVRAESARRSFRILFAKEAKFILLSLAAFAKKTQRTPLREIQLAARRLADWRSRPRRGA
jgi:phage-related protein